MNFSMTDRENYIIILKAALNVTLSNLNNLSNSSRSHFNSFLTNKNFQTIKNDLVVC
jgi:hypothetical protein